MSSHLISSICCSKGRLAAVSVFLFLFLNATFGLSFELLLGTGEQDYFCLYAARAVCRSIERGNSGFSCRVVRSESDVDALTNVQSGTFDFALVDSHLLYESATGKGQFSLHGYILRPPAGDCPIVRYSFDPGG